MNTLAWRTPTTPLPTENNPRVVFERLFGDGGTADAAARAVRRDTSSILDSVIEEMAALQRTLGPADRATVDDYLDAVREVERRIQTGREARRATRRCRRSNGPIGIPERFDEHVKLMFDLQWLAFQADITRVMHVHARPRAEQPHVSGDRRERSAPRAVASRRQARTDRQGTRRSTRITRSCSPSSSRSCERRRTATARCSITR